MKVIVALTKTLPELKLNHNYITSKHHAKIARMRVAKTTDQITGVLKYLLSVLVGALLDVATCSARQISILNRDYMLRRFASTVVSLY